MCKHSAMHQHFHDIHHYYPQAMSTVTGRSTACTRLRSHSTKATARPVRPGVRGTGIVTSQSSVEVAAGSRVTRRTEWGNMISTMPPTSASVGRSAKMRMIVSGSSGIRSRGQGGAKFTSRQSMWMKSPPDPTGGWRLRAPRPCPPYPMAIVMPPRRPPALLTPINGRTLLCLVHTPASTRCKSVPVL